ncbi:hypothetical protein FOA52_011435 [Chlamydomonas sp. UWO 241]|nr:hypothetical protein FOA52_011435 [Chlamydomonas sp. UWO 241]
MATHGRAAGGGRTRAAAQPQEQQQHQHSPPGMPDAYRSVWDAPPQHEGRSGGGTPRRGPPGTSSRAGPAAPSGGIGRSHSPHRSSPHLAPWTFDEAAEQADAAAVYRLEQSRLYRRRAKAAERPPPPAVITQLPGQLDRDTMANALLLVDKPKDWSDDEVERALRWALRTNAVSNAGRLEPLASGLLILCIGAASKYTQTFQEFDRGYSGVIRLGSATDTYDAYGAETESLGWEHVARGDVEAAAARFRGEVTLVAPRFNTAKVGGRRFVVPASDDPDAAVSPRPVCVSSFTVTLAAPGSSPDVEFSAVLGQAGYVRSIAHDFGRQLGTVSHLAALRRESVGPFSVGDAWTLDVLLPLIKRYRKGGRPGPKR